MVKIQADEEMTSWVPNKRAANVEITTKSGQKFSYQADYAPGEPELPMDMDMFKKKPPSWPPLPAAAPRRSRPSSTWSSTLTARPLTLLPSWLVRTQQKSCRPPHSVADGFSCVNIYVFPPCITG